jgi:hypothetical protein
MAADIESSATAKAGGAVRGGAEVGLAKTALKAFTRSFLEVGYSPFMRSIKVRDFIYAYDVLLQCYDTASRCATGSEYSLLMFCVSRCHVSLT